MSTKASQPHQRHQRHLSVRELNRATLERQFLLERVKLSPLRALDRLLAIQAQWPKPPFIALFARLEAFEREALSRLVRENSVVRGTAFRGTIFVMAAKDYASFRTAIAPSLERVAISISGKHVALEDHDRIIEAGRAFFAQEPATFEELRTALSKTAKPKENVRMMAYVVRMRLPLLQVATDVKWGWHTSCDFALAEDVVKERFSKRPDLEKLVLRYLAALGPATLADAQNFTGIKALNDTFESLRPKLVTFLDDWNKELFDLPKAPRPDADTDAPVRFLPDFDNVVLGHADRRRTVPDEYKSRVFLPGLAVARTFLVDGMVAGSWRIEATKKTATLTIEPFGTVTKKTKLALEAEAQRLVEFAEPEANAHTVRFVSSR